MKRPGHDDWAGQSIGRSSHQRTGLVIDNRAIQKKRIDWAGTYIVLPQLNSEKHVYR